MFSPQSLRELLILVTIILCRNMYLLVLNTHMHVRFWQGDSVDTHGTLTGTLTSLTGNDAYIRHLKKALHGSQNSKLDI